MKTLCIPLVHPRGCTETGLRRKNTEWVWEVMEGTERSKEQAQTRKEELN